MKTAIRVLDVGSGPDSVAKGVLESIGLTNLEVTRLDGSKKVHPDIVHDIRKPFPSELKGAFDIVYASHVLEHIDRDKVVQTAKEIASCVRNGGEVWFVVPSMEWAAKQIMDEHDTIGVQAVIYGGQDNPWQYHKVGFTLNALRYVAETECGLIVRRAVQSPLFIRKAGKDYDALQNIVVGMRYDWTEDEGV